MRTSGWAVYRLVCGSPRFLGLYKTKDAKSREEQLAEFTAAMLKAEKAWDEYAERRGWVMLDGKWVKAA